MISCNSVDAETKKEIRDTFRALTDDLLSGDRGRVNQYCTLNGLSSMSKHFDLDSKAELKELGIFFKDQKISGFERIDNTENIKVFIGSYGAVTGKSAIVFTKIEGAWKIERYLAGK